MNAAITANRLFIGILLTPDKEHSLERNIAWKRYCLEHGNTPHRLQKTPYRQKIYLGSYFDSDRIPWSDLASRHKEILKGIEQFFPDIRTDKLKIVVFNQKHLTP
jgi:hypothetical protein